MSFTEAIKTGLQKYADFSGRASRSEYWWFFLFTIIARVLAGLIPGVGFIVGLALLLPTLAATARRLHDTNRTGWWILMPVGIGIAGIIVGSALAVSGSLIWGAGIGLLASMLAFLSLLPFLIQPGDPTPNCYGPDPLQMPPGMRGQAYNDPSHPYTPPYNAAPLEPLPPPSGRQYCPQCGAERVSADAQFCTVCGTAF